MSHLPARHAGAADGSPGPNPAGQGHLAEKGGFTTTHSHAHARTRMFTYRSMHTHTHAHVHTHAHASTLTHVHTHAPTVMARKLPTAPVVSVPIVPGGPGTAHTSVGTTQGTPFRQTTPYERVLHHHHYSSPGAPAALTTADPEFWQNPAPVSLPHSPG